MVPPLLFPHFHGLTTMPRVYTTSSPTPPPSLKNTTIHLLIAHPDDEAMFFAPTLLALTSPALNNTVSVLCLSNGNAENLGPIREKELVASCEILGVDRTRVHSFDHPYSLLFPRPPPRKKLTTRVRAVNYKIA